MTESSFDIIGDAIAEISLENTLSFSFFILFTYSIHYFKSIYNQYINIVIQIN